MRQPRPAREPREPATIRQTLIYASAIDSLTLPIRERAYRITAAFWTSLSGLNPSTAMLIVADGGGNTLHHIASAANVPAGATMVHSFSTVPLHSLTTMASGGQLLQAPIPQDLLILPGWTVRLQQSSPSADALMTQISVVIDP